MWLGRRDCEAIPSGLDTRGIALRNSKQLYKIKSVKIPARMMEALREAPALAEEQLWMLGE